MIWTRSTAYYPHANKSRGNSEEALEAIADFCETRAANPLAKLSFRFITTANSGMEKGWSRSESGIQAWTALRGGQYRDAAQREALAAIRTLLKSHTRPEKVSVSAWQALRQLLTSDDDTHLTDLILGFEWGMGYGDYKQAEAEIIALVKRTHQELTTEEANQAYEHLFAVVFRLLCQRGKKLLAITNLTTELQAASATPADRNILKLIRNELEEMAARIGTVETAIAHQATDLTALKETVGLIGKSFGLDAVFAVSAVSLYRHSRTGETLCGSCPARR